MMMEAGCEKILISAGEMWDASRGRMRDVELMLPDGNKAILV